MLKSRRDAAVMFWVGVAVALVLWAVAGWRAALFGVAWAGFAGVQWLMFANRDVNRRRESP
jgi:hypothetical protein